MVLNWPAGECYLCGHVEVWTTAVAAQHAMVWHMYEEHHGEWLMLVGDRLPRDPRPGMAPGAIRLDGYSSRP